jgi:hypothetical protein
VLQMLLLLQVGMLLLPLLLFDGCCNEYRVACAVK